MSTRTFLKTIAFILLTSFFTLFVGCNDENDDTITDETSEPATIIGKWYTYQETEITSYNGQVVETTITSTYDTQWDVDFFNAEIVEFTATEAKFYHNNPGVDHGCYTAAYKIIGDSVFFAETETPTEYLEGFFLSFDGQQMVHSQGEDIAGWHRENQTVYKPYPGGVPPESWITITPDDSYEPDNSPSQATLISIGEMSDRHSTADGDDDWFKFTATAGETYQIKVSGYANNYVELFDTDASTLLASDDDNDMHHDVETTFWGNPVIVWECPATGTYFFNVYGWAHVEEGYYWVEVEQL